MVAANRAEGRAGELRVLLVEDEIVIAVMLEDMLAELGHKVIGPVARLDKAVAMAQQEAVDVAILDVNLRGKEVYPVADALAARRIPFIFCTGYGKAGLHARYDGRPALQKPFQRHSLRELLAQVCPARPV